MRKKVLRNSNQAICVVYHTILWAAEPLPLIAEAHLLGHRAGLQAGDIMYSCYNMILAIVTNYAAGQNLDTVQESILNFLSMLKSHGIKMFFKFLLLLLAQILVLKGGLVTSWTVRHQPKTIVRGGSIARMMLVRFKRLIRKLSHSTNSSKFKTVKRRTVSTAL